MVAGSMDLWSIHSVVLPHGGALTLVPVSTSQCLRCVLGVSCVAQVMDRHYNACEDDGEEDWGQLYTWQDASWRSDPIARPADGG